jgi:hypothetical protein
MIEAHTYDEVCAQLAVRFDKDYKRQDVNLTGLIFAHPQARFAEAEIVPRIGNWHYRSDNVTDFFCAGFGNGTGPRAPKDRYKVKALHRAGWWFSDKAFDGFVRDIEARSSWKYTGGADLLLTTARYKTTTKKASLDFRSAIVVNLEAVMKDKAVRDPSDLMYRMFEFAQTMNEDVKEPAWELSNKLGLRVMKSSFIDMFWRVVSKLMGKGFQQASHFAVRDISPAPAKK